MADETEERITLIKELAAHAEVLMKAHNLYEERTQSYGQVWRQYGGLSNLLNAARKIDRLMEVWWHGWNNGEAPVIHKEALDDAYDALNYLTFFIRSVGEGNITGSIPVRPDVAHGSGEGVAANVLHLVDAVERSKRRHPSVDRGNDVT